MNCLSLLKRSGTNINSVYAESGYYEYMGDADACPKAIKAVICKAAERKKIPTFFVANHFVSVPPSKVIKSLQVAQGFDVADNTIVERT